MENVERKNWINLIEKCEDRPWRAPIQFVGFFFIGIWKILFLLYINRLTLIFGLELVNSCFASNFWAKIT
jgi:hypothetical protein